MSTTSTPSVTPVVTATPDLAAVVDTLTSSFAADPIIEWAIPSSTPDRRRYLDAFFEITTRALLDGGGHVAATPTYDGVVVWSGTEPATDAENSRMLADLEDRCGPCGPQVRLLMEILDAHHPTDLPPHVHCLYAAVRAEARGSGAREMVIGAFRELRIARGLGVYAEASSERSLKLWKRLGSEQLGEPILLPAGPSLYPIFRSA